MDHGGGRQPRPRRAAHRDTDVSRAAEHPLDGEGEVFFPHGAGLTQWKHERLAHHHAYFALLDRSFARWRQVAAARRLRRQRVIAACRVGAKFFQRLYWDTWRAAVVRRRADRDAKSQVLRALSVKIRLRAAWLKWVRAISASPHAGRNTSGAVERMVAERRLEVRGVRLRKKSPLVVAERPRTPMLAVDANTMAERGLTLKRITVYYTQRHYFQLWREAARAIGKTISQQLRYTADAFRVRSAWKRWRSGFAARSEYRIASRQAIFFLYYHLTKSSMAQLRRFAARQRRERGISVVLSNRVRRRRMVSAFSMWRQRLNSKLVFSRWRDAVAQSSRTQSNPQLRVMHDTVRKLQNDRLLHRAFSLWLEQSSLRRRSRALVRLLDGPLSKFVTAPAFRSWHHQTVIHRRLQQQKKNRNQERLRCVWEAWRRLTKAKSRSAQQRRLATRFWYHKTLRRVFAAFRALGACREEIETAVDVMVQCNRTRCKRSVFDRWLRWSMRRRQCRRALIAAQGRLAVGLKRRAFLSLRLHHQEHQDRAQRAVTHFKMVSHKVLREAFNTWRALYNHEQQRNEDLAARLATYCATRSAGTKRVVLHSLDDYTKSKQSRRLMNAHARGHYQAKLLQMILSNWVSGVAEVKWEHIFNQRAENFRSVKLLRKGFSKWKRIVRAIKCYREKTCRALHHWKRVRERNAFDGWKRYVAARRVLRERMHGALEFRHRMHLRDGLTHWIAGATHLASERSRWTAKMQTMYTERVWCKVRQIAAHWRYITQMNKSRTLALVQPSERVRHTLNPAVFNDERIDHDPHRRVRRTPAAATKRSNEHGQSAALSDFVMLPKNRPRPRKPVELMIENEISGVSVDERVQVSDVGADLFRAVANVNRVHGLQFPPLATELATHGQLVRPPAQNVDFIEGNYNSDDFTNSVRRTTAVVNCSEPTIDELEDRLLQWQKRRQKLKQLQNSLDDFRQLLQQAAMQGNLEREELNSMQSRLRSMEQQEAASRRLWNESRPEIVSLAQRIKLLRGTVASA